LNGGPSPAQIFTAIEEPEYLIARRELYARIADAEEVLAGRAKVDR